jgi:putative Mg2+ transporter-C (MgtC) family protein
MRLRSKGHLIGAGAIMKEGAVATGLATAASVWVVGIIGAAVGYGYYDIGLNLAAANSPF